MSILDYAMLFLCMPNFHFRFVDKYGDGKQSLMMFNIIWLEAMMEKCMTHVLLKAFGLVNPYASFLFACPQVGARLGMNFN
jgi:hypothetical protein